MPSEQPPVPAGGPGPRSPESPGWRPPTRLRVLIVEDEPAHAELEVRELRRAEFAPDWQRVETEQAYLEHLGAPPDLILADYSLPQFGASRALDILNDRGLDIPFIVVSGTMGEEVAVDLMRRGAADYLLKDRLARLGPAVLRVLEQQHLRRQQRQTEEALAVSASRYRSLFEGVPVGLYRTTAGGEILDANPAYLQLVGYPDMETLRNAKAASLYFDPEVRAQWITLLEREGVVNGFESRLRRFDGEIIWVRASARMVRGDSGRVAYLEGAVEDITERKRGEEALTRAREADRANQAKSEFLSRMSHELRTPLNAILGFAQMLESDPLAPEQRESVGYILRGGRHLLGLINEVLDVARIEAGRLSLSPEPVLVPEIVKETVELSAPLAAGAAVQLRADVADVPERHVMADKQRAVQVLLNLVSNAIKYNHRGGTVTLSCKDVAGGRFRISVRDTGPGIPPEGLERLFTPFERLNADTTGVEGSGLGLALSKGLVEAMGGAIGVESIVGQGSTFWTEFPVADGTNRPGEPSDRETPRPDAAGASLKNRTVLYVEDNLSNLKLIERVLARRPGIRILSAMQGRLCLDLTREHHPDLILLDLHLPDIGGAEVLRRLRESPETREIPVVVVSADATPRQIERLRADGARDYLTKPFDVKKFLALVDEILGDGRPRS